MIVGPVFWSQHSDPQPPDYGHSIRDFCVEHYRSLLAAISIAIITPFLNYLVLFAAEPDAAIRDVLRIGFTAGLWVAGTLTMEFVMMALMEARPRMGAGELKYPLNDLTRAAELIRLSDLEDGARSIAPIERARRE